MRVNDDILMTFLEQGLPHAENITYGRDDQMKNKGQSNGPQYEDKGWFDEPENKDPDTES